MNDKTLTSKYTNGARGTSLRGRQAGVVVLFSERCPIPPPRRIRSRCCIGRSPDQDVTLDDPCVSRSHVVLECRDNAVWVSDLGSHNGSYLEGKRLSTEPTLVPFESVLRVSGNFMLIVEDITEFLTSKAVCELPMAGGPRTARLRSELQRMAPSRSPVLVQGETGTGKEQAAKLLHEASGRRGEFIPVNCAAIPSDLVESELFGHVRGAYSGSVGARKGMFRSAHGGTLLLDEVGDLQLNAQAKLLRVIEDASVRPVGDDKATPIDVHIVSATNRPLEDMIRTGGFREDLFHRIAATHVTLPPLRERREDIVVLAELFCRDRGIRISVGAMDRWLHYRWPGNVRELKSEVARVGDIVRARADDLVGVDDVRVSGEERVTESSEQQERVRICAALESGRGNVARAAKDLGMRRTTLYALLKRLQIEPAKYRKT